MKPKAARYRRKSSPSKAYPRPKVNSQRIVRNAILGIALFLIVLFLLSPQAPAVQDLRLFHHTPSHKPPAQKNSTSGEVRWYNDWKWLRPFSDAITLEEDRSVLPPLGVRPPIYTFYDSEEKKDEKLRAAENRLILIWRRAWWAQGFRPVVLGKPEAMKHPLYETYKSSRLQTQMEADLLRWLAWGQMGTGILANWLAFPMGTRDDPLVSTLRNGEYPKLTRYEGLEGGLLSGEQTAINAAINEAISSEKLKNSKSVLDTISRSTLAIDPAPAEIAFYDSRAITEHYKPVVQTLADNKAEGLESLAGLIESHLHLTFLNSFPDGFAVIAPFSDAAAILVQRAYYLARALRSCPQSPIPTSCPPNQSKCQPCSSSSPLPITTPGSVINDSRTYTLGTVPHPYTLASLIGNTKEITTRYIRRDTERDPWLEAVTSKTLGKELGGQGRIVPFKEVVASDWGAARGLWMTEDQALNHKNIEYHFGFSIAKFNTTTTTTTTPQSSSSKSRSSDLLLEEDTIPFSASSSSSGSTSPSGKDTKKDIIRALKRQQDLLIAAQKIVSLPPEKKKPNDDDKAKNKKKKSGTDTSTRSMVEAWNLADTEAWRFVRAFAARRKLERAKWEGEERRFAGADIGNGDAENESEGEWRWFDRSKR